MAQADRIVGEINLFTLGSYALAGTIREGTLTRGMRTAESSAVNDTAEYPKGTKEYFALSATCAMEVADGAACELITRTGETAFTVTPADGSGSWSGICICTEFNWQGGETHTYSIQASGQGTLTWTPAA